MTLETSIAPTPAAMGAQAAARAAALITDALRARGSANVILATGASQFEMLANLVAAPGIHWPRVTCFHLDEYVGLPESHPASFRKYLRERFVQKVKGLYYDCDGDCLLVKVDQIGKAACHTGYRSCFFRKVTAAGTPRVEGKRIFDPAKVYKK